MHLINLLMKYQMQDVQEMLIQLTKISYSTWPAAAAAAIRVDAPAAEIAVVTAEPEADE